MEYKIAIIIPYFGQFPSYFPIWLKSASYNKIDYLIYTDISMDGYEIPSNVIIHGISFEKLKEKIKEKLKDATIKLNNYYKLCDYKVSYGLIFEDDIKDYDFWGHGDLDLVWGNALLGINSSDFDTYQKFFKRGHFCFYRNDEYSRVLHSNKNLKSFFTFEYVYHTNYDCHYDESYEWTNLLENENKKVYGEVRYADIDYYIYRFKQCGIKGDDKDARQVYVWSDGRLFCYYLSNGNIRKKEKNYIHIQKRTMNIRGEIDFNKPILIAPNYFTNISFEEISEKMILENSPDRIIWGESIKRQIATYCRKILNGGLSYKFSYLIYKMRKDKK